MLSPRHLLIVLTSAVALTIGATSASQSAPDNSTAARADRFFSYREWINAGALYTMLLGEDPTNTLFCSRAIVAAGMLGDTIQQTTLTTAALDAPIPVDSLFSAVERTSFSVGQTSLYEEYLMRTKRAEPWLSRIIDGYLMRYYAYRRNPRGMIDYSLIMLQGNPESEPFLYTLAQGFLINGQTDRAIETYRHIVELNPEALEAILYLANFYVEANNPSEALIYFRRAARLQPTPYIENAINQLSAK